MLLPTLLRQRLFALCLFTAHVLHAAPLPANLEPLVVYSGVTATAPSPAATSPYPLSPTPPTSTVTVTDYSTVTKTLTDTVTRTELVSRPPTSSTSSTASSGNKTLSTTRAATPSTATRSLTEPSPTAWSAPSDFDNGNLSAALAIKKWAWGKTNAALVTGIPSSDWVTTKTSPARSSSAPVQANQAKAFPRVDLANSTMLRVDFPEGSINPGNKTLPTGGIGLYMTPLNLSTAKNVTFSYSVFFPADFDFVKGGKLPGLYGGKEGCSGGDDAEDCWSTRTMWRTDGKGELYLYAPRDGQPEALCETPPLTYCDTTYGMSIGRGAWNFTRGGWTTVRQTVKLNTPGIADGAFRIFVNDALVLSSDAVLFRKNLAAAAVPSPSSTSRKPSTTTTSRSSPTPESSKPSKPSATASSAGLLGGLLNGLGLGNILVDASPPSSISSDACPPSLLSSSASSSASAAPLSPAFPSSTLPVFHPTRTLLPPVFPDALNSTALVAKASSSATKTTTAKNAGFSGAMVQTFFGGSDPSWASPRDQHMFFDRFSIVVNE
ncbi:hypothetical protein JCM8097_007011 [Rhodosporidiobolus ruineniae]